ncbi:MAG: hypothetical protein A2511_01895 [Deltaproteobacteria bacterium RIFOXYD12_FULL_50_9]|nr:MAG: hypothetical protein A2511_01895 [Deltaproteobacteria bacterium RIFOXYD12_FULL_50_9]
MITLIKKMFQGGEKEKQASFTDSEMKKRIAACVLLLEVAHADDECSPAEMAHIVETVKARFALSQAYATELLELADRERRNSVDLWQFTNYLNQKLSKDEKMAVLEDVWRIIFVDGHLEMHEDHLAHKLANLLQLTHKELIDVKLKAKAGG